jgi:hypothetical protein
MVMVLVKLTVLTLSTFVPTHNDQQLLAPTHQTTPTYWSTVVAIGLDTFENAGKRQFVHTGDAAGVLRTKE